MNWCYPDAVNDTKPLNFLNNQNGSSSKFMVYYYHFKRITKGNILLIPFSATSSLSESLAPKGINKKTPKIYYVKYEHKISGAQIRRFCRGDFLIIVKIRLEIMLILLYIIIYKHILIRRKIADD